MFRCLVWVLILCALVMVVIASPTSSQEIPLSTASPIASPTVPPSFELTGEWNGGRFLVTAEGVDIITDPILFDLYDEILTPRGMFAVLSVTVTNLGTDPEPFWESHMLRLRDDQGRAFSPDNDATSAVVSNQGMFVPAYQPDLSYDDIVVFDVATDAKTFAIEVVGTDINVPVPLK